MIEHPILRMVEILLIPQTNMFAIPAPSGTTGDPTTWMDTQKDWQWMLENWKRIMEAAQVEEGSRCFFAFRLVPFLDFGLLMRQLYKMGALQFRGVGNPPKRGYGQFWKMRWSIFFVHPPMRCD